MSKLLRYPFLVTLLLALLVAPSLPYAASQEQATVDAIQKRYETVITFQAKFVQRSFVKMMDRTQESRGIVQIKKPGRMKWDYNAPDPQTLVSNQETLWLYVPEDEQVTKMPMESIYSSNTPALFLAGKGKLTDAFNIGQVIQEENRIAVVLVPKEEEHGVQSLTLYADKKNYQILGSSVYDKLGNRTEIRFSDITVNKNIPEETFTFKIPEGVEVLDYSPSSENKPQK